VVENTVSPCCFAIAAAATPTDDVPPRMSSVCPGAIARPVCSDPCAVCSISGKAPSVAQSRSVVTGMTDDAGTTVYSAYPPSYSRPIPPIIATTCCPGSNSPPGARSTVPAASIPGITGNRALVASPARR
jgi:hypothetical protein